MRFEQSKWHSAVCGGPALAATGTGLKPAARRASAGGGRAGGRPTSGVAASSSSGAPSSPAHPSSGIPAARHKAARSERRTVAAQQRHAARQVPAAQLWRSPCRSPQLLCRPLPLFKALCSPSWRPSSCSAQLEVPSGWGLQSCWRRCSVARTPRLPPLIGAPKGSAAVCAAAAEPEQRVRPGGLADQRPGCPCRSLKEALVQLNCDTGSGGAQLTSDGLSPLPARKNCALFPARSLL